MENRKTLAYIAAGVIGLAALVFNDRNSDMNELARWEKNLAQARTCVQRGEYEGAERLISESQKSINSYRKDSILGGLSFLSDEKLDKLTSEFSALKRAYKQ